MSDYLTEYQAGMVRAGWKIESTGQAGSLWRLGDKSVAVPFGLTPGTYDWRSVVSRTGLVMPHYSAIRDAVYEGDDE